MVADELASEEVRRGNGGAVSTAYRQRIEDNDSARYMANEIGLPDLFRPEVIELYRTPASGRNFLVVPKAD